MGACGFCSYSIGDWLKNASGLKLSYILEHGTLSELAEVFGFASIQNLGGRLVYDLRTSLPLGLSCYG